MSEKKGFGQEVKLYLIVLKGFHVEEDLSACWHLKYHITMIANLMAVPTLEKINSS